MYTPRHYVQQIERHLPGTPEHTVATMRAHLAVEAAKARRDGNYGRASLALAGLGKLAAFGEVDASALTRNINNMINARRAALGPEAAAALAGRASLIAGVAQFAGGLTSIIARATNDPGVMRMADWVNLILTGRMPTSISQSELMTMASACQVWNSSVKPVVNGLAVAFQAAALTGDLATAFAGGAGSSESTPGGSLPSSIVDEGFQVASEVANWIIFALDTICSELLRAFPAASSTQSCAADGRRPQDGTAAGCCPGLVLHPSGYCRPEAVPLTAEQNARRRWQRAYEDRRTVETMITSPTVTPEVRANGLARDRASADELCAAGADLLNYIPVLPSRGTPPTESMIQSGRTLLDNIATGRADPNATSTKLIGAIVFSGLGSYMPGGATPRCYIVTPPVGGCRAPCTGGSGGGGNLIAIALPAAALAWYMMRG